MNKKQNNIALVILGGLLISNMLMYYKVSDMKYEIQNLRNQVIGVERSIDSSISNISSSVSYALEKEASLINDFKFVYGDIKNGEVDLQLRVSPKEISQQKEYFFSYSMDGEGRIVDANISGETAMIADIEVPINSHIEVDFIVKDGETRKVETLEHIYPLEERLVEPFRVERSSSGISYYPSNTTVKLDDISYNLTYSPYEYKEGNYRDKSLNNIKLYISVNDDIIDTFTMEKSDEDFPPRLDIYTYSFDQYALKLSNGDNLEIYALVDHEDGYKVRITLDKFSLDEDGEHRYDRGHFGDEKSIVY